jgi:protein-S-isoprenylcysteine O-methyltransferase Ste14
MRAREAIGFLVAVLFVVVFTIGSVVSFLVGAETPDAEDVGGAVLVGLGALGWFIYMRRSLEKQGVPWRCSAEAAQFHKFKETGNPYEEPRILECSGCGVHRQVRKKQQGGDGA